MACFVEDDSALGSGEHVISCDLIQCEWESLQSDYDYLTSVVQSFCKLLVLSSLWAGVLVAAYHLDKSRSLFELLYRTLDI